MSGASWNALTICGDSRSFMLKFSKELIIHKSNVLLLLYAAGGLLMISGGVDVDVMTVQNPTNLRRLSHLLMRLVGLRHQIQAVRNLQPNFVVKRKQLYVTDSLLHLTGAMCDFNVFCWFPASAMRRISPQATPADRVLTRRCRIHYILICAASGRAVLTLCVGSGNKMKTYYPENHLRWLIDFSNKTVAPGDQIFLLLGGKTGQICPGSVTNQPRSLTLGLSVLSVVFLWMSVPYIVIFALICVGWNVYRQYFSKT